MSVAFDARVTGGLVLAVGLMLTAAPAVAARGPAMSRTSVAGTRLLGVMLVITGGALIAVAGRL